MTSYVTPKKNAEFIYYLPGLLSVANPDIFQVNPTLATGDVKVSIDGGALANLGTLPTVTPSGGSQVKITLSNTEMNGDNITVHFLDAAGNEWKQVGLNIQTSARQIDDLATQTSVDDLPTNAELATALGTADDAVLTQVALVKAKTDNLPSDPADASDIAAATAAIAGYIDTEVASILAAVDTEVADIKAKTDNLPSDPADASVIAGLIAAVEAKVDTVDTVVDAVKVKTDQLTFTVAGEVDANAKSMNDAEILGNGTSGNLWRGS